MTKKYQLVAALSIATVMLPAAASDLEELQKSMESPEMTEAIDRLSVFLGPFFASVGDAVLGTRGGGITPEFARVLRTQILEKDRRFVIIEPGVKGSPLLRWGHRFRAEVSDDE